jgi:serine/threonine protein kinase
MVYPIQSIASDPYLNSYEKANRLIQEYEYHDLNIHSLRSICCISSILLEGISSHNVESVHVHGIDGVFYAIPATKSVLYLPGSKGKKMLGRGCHKKAYRALYITKDGIEVVAACIGDKTVFKEAEILKSLSMEEAINPYRCSFQLPNEKYMLVLRYYNMGSFSSLRKKKVKVTEEQKLFIAKDVLQSLIAMHKKSVAHRDLHEGNILVHQSKNGVISAGLIDFGRALHMFAKSKNTPQGASRRNPPEVFLIPMKDVSKKSADIYALGCFFFTLFFEREYEGALVFDSHIFHRMSEQDKMRAYALVKEKYNSECRVFKESTSSGSMQRKVDTFKSLIFQMIHPVPKERIELQEVSDVLGHVFEQQ